MAGRREERTGDPLAANPRGPGAALAPVTRACRVGPEFAWEAPAASLTVLRLPGLPAVQP